MSCDGNSSELAKSNGPSQAEPMKAKPERADKRVVVPKAAATEKWTAERAQEWARIEVLAGGPPDKPEDPNTGIKVEWADLKDIPGQKIRIRARPMGLILVFENGTRRFAAGDATSSSGGSDFPVGTGTEAMRKKADEERRIREFAKKEIDLYNKKVVKHIRESQNRFATREFWESGCRIDEFLLNNKDITRDQLLHSLEQWGRGRYGYGREMFEYATYFHEWKRGVHVQDNVFQLSETRVMNIIRASKVDEHRSRLLQACTNGPFKELADEEFKWITGQSSGTFPIEDVGVFKSLGVFGKKVSRGETLTDGDIKIMTEILTNARLTRK